MNRFLLPILIVACVVLGGCYSRLTGTHGKITFAYPAVADVTNFNKPIAPGARLVLKGLEVGNDDEELQILSLESQAPDVLRVVSVDPSAAILQGVSVGSARLEMRARDRYGRVFTDTVTMTVDGPDHVVFQHACTDGEFAAYPANAEISIPFAMSKGNGQPVIGYGFHPVSVTPKAALELDTSSQDQGALHFKSTKPRHRVALRSTIDDGILGLALVEPGEVDGFHADSLGATVVGGEAFAFFQPTVIGVPLCQGRLLIRARSTTPSVCTATARLGDDGDEENRLSIVRIFGKDYGICEFEVTYPEAEDGEGLTRTFRMPVGKFPSLDAREASSSQPPWWVAPLLALLVPLTLAPFVLRRR